MSLDTIHITIDLGLDSVKVAYAYTEDKVYRYGKIADYNGAYPAWAYFNEDKRTWAFGQEAIRFDQDKSYKNLVKIKSLLMMLQKEENTPYYLKKKHFPNFYFPTRVKHDDRYETDIAEGHTFEANCSPREVCCNFFRDLFANFIFPALDDMEGFDKTATVIDLSVLYPAVATETVINELRWLVYQAADAFNAKYKFKLDKSLKMVNGLLSTKATAIYAYRVGILSDNDTALIFNIGESDISVSKVSIQKINDASICITVDGADGHLPPDAIGGADIDAAIKKLIDEKLIERTPLGQSADSKTAEDGTYKQQYSLLRAIKKNKEYFSDDFYPMYFADGIPFSVMRDLVYDVVITQDDIRDMLTSSPDAIGARIADYVIREVNADDKHEDRAKVNKILFVGGAAETYSLKDYVSEQGAMATRAGIQWIDLDDAEQDLCSDIAMDENEVYAAAAGGALYSAGFVELKTLLRKYYGTWMTRNSDVLKIKYFAPFKFMDGSASGGGMRPGAIIPDGGAVYHTKEFALGANATIADEMYSTDSTPLQGEIQLGNPGSMLRKNAMSRYGLKVLCRGNLINTSSKQIVCVEGVEINADGRAKPFLRATDPANNAFVKFEFDGEISLLG